MMSSQKYRAIALMLAVVFAVFNIGLPIVVASCPMMDMTRGSVCCAMGDDATSGVVKFTKAIDKSCCQTKYAADRNKNEFLQEQLKQVELAKLFVASITSSNIQFPTPNHQSLIALSASPPRSVDIPILISSLLI